MMKALVINGSPRLQGNCDLLCDAFIQGALEAGHQTEKINLTKYDIHYCKACYACFKSGTCVQKDDMTALLNKIEEADCLVLASPTYFLTMSGQMKVMIDRLLPQWQNLGHKQGYVIVTGHDGKEGLRRTGYDLRDILEALGCKCQTIIWGEHVWQKGEVLQTQAMEEAYNVGKHIS